MNVELIQFLITKGSGEAAMRRFLSFADKNGADAAIDVCLQPEALSNATGLKLDVCKNIVSSRDSARNLFDKLVANYVEMLWLGHPSYPERLKSIIGKNSPPVIFVMGNKKLFEMKAVGFCGSRKSSEKGLLITERCCNQLVKRNFCVVSGYAHGVDMTAHRAALKSGGTTIIVLVEGILKFQEKQEVKELLTTDNYLVVSQFPPLLTWVGRNAMKRNSTIIGLSDAMILVESGTTGGTFAAGEETLKRKRPLFVIDYAAPGPSAKANPYFIERGGIPIRGNKKGIPNLSQLFEVASKQSWKALRNDNADLFSWRGIDGGQKCR